MNGKDPQEKMSRPSAPPVNVVRFPARTALVHRLTQGGADVPPPSLEPVQELRAATCDEVRTLRHEVDLEAPPQAVFDALMDEQQHAAFTGYEASIDWREGGRFITGGERNFGYTLSLVFGRKIVQAWAHRSFPRHHYSIVTFELEPRGSGTRLVFTQQGVPADACGWLDEGWQKSYWEPLQRFLREADSPT